MAAELWLVDQSLQCTYIGIKRRKHVFDALNHLVHIPEANVVIEDVPPNTSCYLQLNSARTRFRAIRVNVGLTQYASTKGPVAVARGITGTIVAPTSSHYVRISMLDVGQGDSTFVFDSIGVYALIDFGSKKNADVTVPEACKFIFDSLSAANKAETLVIDVLCFTHGDGDHYNRFEELLNYVREKKRTLRFTAAYLGGTQGDYPKSFLDLVASCTEEMFHFNKEATFPRPLLNRGHLKMMVLSANEIPAHSGESRKNCSSLVILIHVTNGSDKTIAKYLVMGDAEETVERALIENCADEITEIDALRTGHHGSSKACCEDFLNVAKPRVAYISTDAKWAHPYPDFMERLRACPSLASIDDAHAIVVSATRSNLDYENEQEQAKIYTTMVDIEPDESDEGKAKVQAKDVQPVTMTGARHDFFVDILGEKIWLDNSSSTSEKLEQLPERDPA